jgi:hypothetical protein
VPPELHRQLRYADRLPLFQMIAKNVGIRRARGRFVLATNVDVLLSDELMRFLAARRLQPRHLYRLDRYDVDCRIEPHRPVDEQLAACERSLIRVCRREGTHDLRTGEFFRIYDRAGHFAHSLALRLADRGFSGILALILRQIAFGQRVLKIAVIRIPIRLAQLARHVAVDASRRTQRVLSRTIREARRFRHPERIPRVIRRNWRRLRTRIAARTRRQDSTRAEASPLLALALLLRKLVRSVAWRLTRAAERVARGLELRREGVVLRFIALQEAWQWDRARLRLHTNACGDFTLLAREDWIRTRGYPELEIFSMHLDSLFLYQAHYTGVRERFLPYRVFHFEHDAGFKPDEGGLRDLNERLDRDAIPQVTNEQFLAWALEMLRSRSPVPFNGSAWGFADETLAETAVAVAREAADAAIEPTAVA